MSIARDGMNSMLKTAVISTIVDSSDPLIRLGNAIDWPALEELCLEDLKKTTSKGYWWLGRKLYLRVLFLQTLHKETDRGIEKRIKETPVFQVFCGLTTISQARCPDSTKIEEFRNRLSPETHQKIGVEAVKVATSLGFANPKWMDIDSTIQEANMSYPSDASLMRKLSQKAQKALEAIGKTSKKLVGDLKPDFQAIHKQAKNYFFIGKRTVIEKRREAFKTYNKKVRSEILPVIDRLEKLPKEVINRLKWNVRQAVEQVVTLGRKYLSNVQFFILNHTPAPGKRMSFHVEQVACFNKGKAGKKNEFGRNFQLGRMGGNFLLAFPCTSVRMEDKKAFVSLLHDYQTIFGKGTLKEVGTDKGYYSQANIKGAEKLGINADGLQRPIKAKNQPPLDRFLKLRDRRAGIEPLIGHAKAFGLRKSRMKSDRATEASGYRSVLGFNLSQLARKLA